MTLSRYHILAAAAFITFLGCSGDSHGTGPDGGPHIRFVSGNHLSDTVSAQPETALVLTVFDSSGHVAPLGTVVRFTGLTTIFSANSPYPNLSTPELLVRGPTANDYTPTAAGTTDASGRIAVSVQFGVVAGQARLAIDVPTLGITDTARFTVLAGTPTQAIVGPADTAMYVGATFHLRGGTADRFGNIRDTSASWHSTTITVDANGTVHATTVGRYELTATVGTQQLSAWVSVVPKARIAANSGERIVTFDLDGSHYDTLTTDAGSPYGPLAPRWIPNTNKILYPDPASSILHTVDTTGAVALFFNPAPTTFVGAAEAQPTSQGNWIYFGALDAACTGSSTTSLLCLYRAKPDGSSIQRLGTHIQQAGTSFSPAPSPDGSKVAFVTDSAGYSVIRILDVASNTLASPIILGVNPSWSPDGAHIAYLSSFDGSLQLMNADGTGSDVVRPVRYYNRQPISWSPDGTWIIMMGDSGLEIVNMHTGVTIPVRFGSSGNSTSLSGPSWR